MHSKIIDSTAAPTYVLVLDPGDEAIVFEPYYGYHVNTLLAIGA